MFRKILFPTDFSRHADKVLQCIPDLQEMGMKEALLIHVINPMKAARWISVDEQIIEKARDEAKRSMEQAIAAMESSFRIRATYRIETGVVYREIERVAKEEGASLIIMGSHGHGFIKGAFLGSVTQNMMRCTPVPLIIEKFKEIRKNGRDKLAFVSERMFAKILFPTDFSENSLLALRMIQNLRTAGVRDIVVAHIQEAERSWYLPGQTIEEMDRIASAKLSRLRQQLEFWGYDVETILREAIPGREINAIAEERDVSMIILGSHGTSAFKDVLTGSVAETVALRHIRPLMIIPRHWKTREGYEQE